MPSPDRSRAVDWPRQALLLLVTLLVVGAALYSLPLLVAGGGERWGGWGFHLLWLALLAVAVAAVVRFGQRLTATRVSLRRWRERYRIIFEQAAEGMAVADPVSYRLLEVNPAARRLFGLPGEGALPAGLTLQRLLEGSGYRLDRAVEQALRERRGCLGEVTLGNGDTPRVGEVCLNLVSAAGDDLLCLFVRDVTLERQAEAQYRRLARFDPLTGLPNRTACEALLEQTAVERRRRREPFGVVLVELERLETVADALGRQQHDALLREAAARLAAVAGSGEPARSGERQFALLVRDGHPRALAERAQRALDALAVPFECDGGQLQPAAAVGIALWPADGAADELLQCAEVAAHQARGAGGGRYRFFTEGMNRDTAERLRLERRLNGALGRHELYLEYQPQVELADGRIVGMEALLRWRHPELGEVPPDRFIPVAEESGLIEAIGDWVLRAACRQLKAWQQEGLPALRVAVNLSPCQFRPYLVERVAAALAESGLDPHCLELELTEGMLLVDEEEAVRMLTELKEMGVHLAIDDFGTGHAGVGYLKRLPVDTLKIDRSFVAGACRNPSDAALVSTIVAMAHHLKLRVVAEGVEEREQVEFLDLRRCDEVQGFYCARPMGPEAMAALLRAGRLLPSTRAVPAAPLPEWQAVAVQRQPLTVLVADDDPSIRLLLTALLAKDGHHVLLAEDGRQAVELFHHGRPDLVLLDVEMPEMNGYEAAWRIKQAAERFVPVIFLTGVGDDYSLACCIEAGGDDFLTKPCNRLLLRAKMDAHQRIRQLNHQLAEQHDRVRRHEAQLEREHEVAERIFANILDAAIPELPGLRYLLEPAAAVNGDLLLAAEGPAGRCYALLGDFTFHGLSAAVGALPVAELFRRHTAAGESLEALVAAINRRLKAVLPTGMFFSACLIEWVAGEGRLRLWSGGVPELLLCREGEGIVRRLDARHLPLGIVAERELDTAVQELAVRPGDRLYLYSDGVIETENGHGEQYGQGRLEGHLVGVGIEGAFDAIRADLAAFRGSAPQLDDVTLLEIVC